MSDRIVWTVGDDIAQELKIVHDGKPLDVGIKAEDVIRVRITSETWNSPVVEVDLSQPHPLSDYPKAKFVAQIPKTITRRFKPTPCEWHVEHTRADTEQTIEYHYSDAEMLKQGVK